MKRLTVLLFKLALFSQICFFRTSAFGITGDVPLVLFVSQPRIDFDQSNKYSKVLTNTIRSELNKSSKYKLANPEEDSDVEKAKNFYEQCKSLEECARKDAEAEGAEIVLITEISQIENQCRITMRLENIFRKEIIKNKSTRANCAFGDLESKITELIYVIMKDDVVSGTGARPAQITSNPPGAKLTINGRYMGQTPWTGNIQVGKIDILMEIEGKNRFSPIHLNELVAESKTTFTYSKSFAERNAYLLFDVSPGLSNIQLNGQVINIQENRRIPVEVSKENEIVISAQKYKTQNFNTPSLEPDQEFPIKINLTPNPCTLKLSSNPSEAEVFIDDKKVGSTPLTNELPVGDHKVEIHRQFYDAEDLSFYCGPEQVIQKVLILKRSKYTSDEQEKIDSAKKWRTRSYYGFGFGAILGGLSYSKFSDFKKIDEQYQFATDPFEIQSLREKRDQAKNQSVTFAGASIVTFGLSYMLFKWGDFPEDLKQKSSVVLLPSSRGGEIKWAFSW